MRNHRGRINAVLLAALFAGGAFAAPYTGYYYPSSVQVGTTTRVVVGGMGLGGVKGAWVSGTGVSITNVAIVPGFPRAVGATQTPWVMNWLYDLFEGRLRGADRHRKLPPEALDDETDWSECAWWSWLDDRDELELQIVARDRYTPENALQATPALDQLMILDVKVEAAAKPGRRDILVFDDHGASPPHSFFLTKEPHAAEPFFVIPPRNLRNKPLSVLLHCANGIKPQTLPVVLDGQVWPGETDSFYLRLEEGQHLVCALTGRELLPYLGDAVPGFFNPVLRLFNSRDEEVAFADDFFYLPDPVLTYTVPDAGFYRLDIHDNLFRGRSDFVYTVSCFNAADESQPFTPQARAFVCFPPPAAHEVPAATERTVVKRGVVNCPGRVIRHTFKVEEPGRWGFELFARRLGSPLDGVVRLYGPVDDLPISAAPRLAEWDDIQNKVFAGSVPQAECDPIASWRFTRPGTYCATVTDRYGSGGDDYSYALVMRPHAPSFEVYATPSSFYMPLGAIVSFTARIVRRDGFTGAVTLEGDENFNVSGTIGEGQTEARCTISAKSDFKEELRLATFTAVGRLPDGSVKRVRVSPCDSVEQAFAYTHLLPQRAFFLAGESFEQLRRADKPSGMNPPKKKD